MDDQEAFLRRKAQQCRDMARYHQGEAAAALIQMAAELDAKADEIARERAPGDRTGTRRSQASQ